MSPIAAARIFMRYPAERRQDIINKLRHDKVSRTQTRRRRVHRYLIVAAFRGEITING